MFHSGRTRNRNTSRAGAVPLSIMAVVQYIRRDIKGSLGELAPSSAVQCIPWLSNEPPFLRSIDAYRNLPDTSGLFIWNGANQEHPI